MIRESDKYRSDIFKIIGLAMLTPFGKLLIDPITIFSTHSVGNSIFIAISSTTSFILGILLITKGFDILET